MVDRGAHAAPTTWPNAVAPLVGYCLSSIGMTLINKMIVNTYHFHLTFFTLLIQGCILVLLLLLCLYMNLLSFKPMRYDLARQWLPVSFLLCTMLFTGIKALEYIAIPLFTIFKNLTIIVIAYGELFIWGTPVTNIALLSFVLMVISAVMGGYTDIEFNLVGYLWMFANCITSSVYVLYLRVAIKSIGLEDFEIVYYNNLLSLPILLVLSLWDIVQLVSSNHLASDSATAMTTGPLVLVLIGSGMSSFLISYCSIWCVRATSSTTYSMAGAINKLPLAVAGMLFFHSKVTVGGVLSVIAGLGAGLLYTYSKTRPPTIVSVSDLAPNKPRMMPKTPP